MPHAEVHELDGCGHGLTLDCPAPQRRAVLVLRDLEGLDETAAAAGLDLPIGTVKSRLHRARRLFRKEWTA